jgi:pyrroloquinoline quinone (PQQ) biosynthesis protein C
MILKHKLLDHPFYKDWEKGAISIQQLSNYSKSYKEFITQIPVYWDIIIKNFDFESAIGKKIIADERHHIFLWNEWADKLPETLSYPAMKDEIDTFNKMNASELLGAIHAFEIQQPEAAKTKKAGLIKYYGFNETDTKYFDEHINEAEHIKYGEYLYNNFANKKDFEKGFSKGAELIFHSLDKFLN